MMRSIAGLANRRSSAMFRPLRVVPITGRAGEEAARGGSACGGDGNEVIDVAASGLAFDAGDRSGGHGSAEGGDAGGQLGFARRSTVSDLRTGFWASADVAAPAIRKLSDVWRCVVACAATGVNGFSM